MGYIGTRVEKTGYELLRAKDRLRNIIFFHVLVAEKALGKPLPKMAVVHHANEDKADNSPGNLVICPDSEYHKLLHRRMRAKKACGSPSWLRCYFCKEYDDPQNLYINSKRPWQGIHRKCEAKYRKKCRENPEVRKRNSETMRRWYLAKKSKTIT